MSLKIWHISDTHGNHDQLEAPEVDMIIFSGDATNSRNPKKNLNEFMNFYDWFKGLDIKYKVMIAGNHDTAFESKWIDLSKFIEDDIHYLEDSLIEIEGIKIYGSPFTPTFNNWAFNKSRHSIHEIWDKVPNDTDILITHAPPQGILDLATRGGREYDFCGCKNLLTQVTERIKPKLHLFGHIHNHPDHPYINNATLKYKDVIFSNAAVVEDGVWGIVRSNGNILCI